MAIAWWWLWILFMLLILGPSVGYGWGYRRWGAPFPRYVQRRRALRASVAGDPSFNHHAWGWGGDVVWFMLVLWIVWVFLMPWGTR